MQPRQCAVAALAVFLMLNVAAGVSAAGINWNQTYSSVQVTRFEDYIRKAFICNGTYTLCAYAQCRITSQSINSNTPIAECGCYNKRGLNLGAPPGILSWKAREATAKDCNPPTSGCIKLVNKAPMCKLQQPGRGGKPDLYNRQFDIISTYWFVGWPNATTTQTVCTSGQYTNCYSAGCKNQTAWNGAPTTCYCPVINVTPQQKQTFFVTNPSGSCTASRGLRAGSIVYNGIGIGPTPFVQ